MKCPYCGNEMTHGVVQSASRMFFTTKLHTFIFRALGPEEVPLSTYNWGQPTCFAEHCPNCKKVIIDYSEI